MNLHLSEAFRLLLLLIILGTPTHRATSAQTPEIGSQGGWSLNFKQNAILPPGFRQFSNPRSDGTTQTGFLVDRNNCLIQRKPLMIYIDGSGAQSHFFVMPDGRLGTTVYAQIGPLASDEYHVASCDKRGIKVGYMGELGTGTGAPLEYHQHATFEGRVAEVRLLMDRLLLESMVDPSRVVLVGHSEGAAVAAGAAAQDPRVTHLAFLAGGGPTQVFDFLIGRRKKMAREGNSPIQIVESLDRLEEEFRKIFADPENDAATFEGHSYRRWASFCTHPPIESLLKTKANLFLANGTEDKNSPIESFDLIVAEMIRHRRTNMIARRYPGCDHGLSQPGANGPFEDVFGDILKWARK